MPLSKLEKSSSILATMARCSTSGTTGKFFFRYTDNAQYILYH